MTNPDRTPPSDGALGRLERLIRSLQTVGDMGMGAYTNPADVAADLRAAIDQLATLTAERDILKAENDDARALLMTRYVTGDVVKMLTAAMGDLTEKSEMICRLRGEANANEDLKRFVDYVDHTHHMSPGHVSLIIDFAQGQLVRADRLQSISDRRGKALEPFAKAFASHGGHYSRDVAIARMVRDVTYADFRAAASALLNEGE